MSINGNNCRVTCYLSGSNRSLNVVLFLLRYPWMLCRGIMNNKHPDDKPQTTNGT